MSHVKIISQQPEPGRKMVKFCGDVVTFFLTVSKPLKGNAWIRTNLGNASVSRREVINRVEKGRIQHNEAWRDIAMIFQGRADYCVTLPLIQTGHFEAKCYFIPNGSDDPIWAEGDNCVINVEPSGTCCANIIYNAFVRQFGSSKDWNTRKKQPDSDMISALDKKGYSVIPDSGKFRDLVKEIPFIFSTLGCRALLLLPIHPTPTTYARMGRYGSPYAALNFTEVDPALATFDPSATPLEQFMELVDAVHSHGGYLILDIAINHTGWAAAIHESHPEWLVRGDDGKIEVPGAWGNQWEDLTKLDYSNQGLWQYMAGIFLLWCRRGVDGFRCDAGYMIPISAWHYIVAKVRQEYPDTVFFLEGLGGPLDVTCDLLNTANLNWAYSELFQNYDPNEIEDYLPRALKISEQYGSMIHFCETHDNLRLASVSKRYAVMRTAICALFSHCGGFGFANGVEWFATEKIDVHESPSLNWGAEENQVDHIIRLNHILKNHPCFGNDVRCRFIHQGHRKTMVLLRCSQPGNRRVLICANLDCEKKQQALWSKSLSGIHGHQWMDLITKKKIKTEEEEGLIRLDLDPGEVLALVDLNDDVDFSHLKLSPESRMPEQVLSQKLKNKALAIYTVFNGYGHISGFDPGLEAGHLLKDPVEFCRSLNRKDLQSRVINWQYEKDQCRHVMIPPGFFLLVTAYTSFRAEIAEKEGKRTLFFEESYPMESGGCFALFLPLKIRSKPREAILKIRVFKEKATLRIEAPLLFLSDPSVLNFSYDYTRQEVLKDPSLKLLSTTNTGGMMRASAWWGRLESRYDGLLSANLNSDYPEDRWMFLSRFRIWAVYQDYSRSLDHQCLERFTITQNNCGFWLFRVPTCEGKSFFIKLVLCMDRHNNSIRLTLKREDKGCDYYHLLPESKKVKLILRPDIEDRSFHDTVKAWTGPEELWPSSITTIQGGFEFSPAPERCLSVTASKGSFVPEPEWQYMVNRSLERVRGLDPDSDLFSPGYFSCFLKGSETVVFKADAVKGKLENSMPLNRDFQDCGFTASSKEQPFIGVVLKSLDAFIVDRGRHKSVIAGYPWFLDWGRDSLIVCRCLVEAGRLEEAKSMLRLFSDYEEEGSLPNMISGISAANRETSDAPLWLFAAAHELYKKEGSAFLDEPLGKRSIRKVLVSIAKANIKGGKTGVAMDTESCLLYSPSHFTWMDTNFPAGSPRQGYPVEIQALWYYALMFLHEIDGGGKESYWKTMARTVQNSILNLFWLEEKGYFSDCLHSNGNQGAANAVPDDHLRPNQLFLITLGVVTDTKICIVCMESCLELLVPGAIRSLADRRLNYPLAILHNNELLNDPNHPFSGRYLGDEDTKRKPAYHNGTAWTWPFPVFCEAWALVFKGPGISTSLAWLGSSFSLLRSGCAGFIPEIVDGNFPHLPRGCDAQAWGSSELARVWLKLLKMGKK